MNPWLAFLIGWLTSPIATVIVLALLNNQSGDHRHYGRHDDV